jgi:hypothetical protein
MMFMARLIIFNTAFLAFCAMVNIAYFARSDEALTTKLHELDQMRNGKNTPFDEVENRGKELLAKYTSPEDQAQIYFHLTEIHGQSGMANADLVIQHAQSALALPVDNVQRLRLYVYWGDAIRIANQHKPIQERKPYHEIRSLAVKPYLEGLNEMRKNKIPVLMPNLPRIEKFPAEMSKNDPMYQQLEKKHDAQVAAWMQARIDRNIWTNRMVLNNQVVDLYSRKPYAATELRQLATKILEDPAEVDALMKLIEDKGALKDDPIPEKANAKTPDK